ncbi:MAG TPA: FkbM family methyltransferase [Actinobacteria bacterium]|nr:FkbM family methyltransferase [Actinomycetota bacterium]HCK79686.1 FkbM family methyltransferase [Actinomycetota bacterium]
MPRTSYAGNHEDIVLTRAFVGITDGFFIDIGAAHPTDGSVTKLLYDAGWSGLNVEPLPAFVNLLLRDRPRDITVACAVSDRDGGQIELAYGASAYGASADIDAVRLRTSAERDLTHITTPLRSVDSLWRAEAEGRHVHLLKIDVEGMELPALQGTDLAAMNPEVVMVEATEPYSTTPSHAAWEPLVLSAGYQCALFDGVNRFYARPENAALFARLSVPANVLDDFIPAAYQRALEELAELRDLTAQGGQRAGHKESAVGTAAGPSKNSGRSRWLRRGARR